MAARRARVRRPSPPAPAPPHPSRSGTGTAVLLLVAITLVAYAPALRDGFVWDDDQYVTANATLRTLDGLRRIWAEPGAVPQYYPLTFTSFWLEYRLWGLDPAGYHLVNVLLHTVNAVLVWLLLRRLRAPAAWLAAALFALHPIQVESVAWVTERKNVLSTAFALAAAFLGLGGAERSSWRRDLGVGALFVAALLSKSVTCTLPAVLLVLAWWRRGTIERGELWRLGPLFVVGVAMAFVTIWMEQHHVGATGEAWNLSLVDRTLVAGRVFWFYPRKFLWPHALTFIYPRWSIDAAVWWQYLFPVAAGGLLVTLWVARGRLGRGPLAGTLLYVGTLAPALGFVNVFPMRYSFVADHFAYLPTIALAAMVAAAGAALATRLGSSTRRLANAVVLAGLGVLTARQCGVYRDLRTLWTDTIAKNPSCWMAHNNLGGLFLKTGALDDAVAHLTESLRLKPDNAEAENDLAVAFDMRGQSDAAIVHYDRALQLRPEYANAHYNFAGALLARGDVGDAIAHLEAAARLKSDDGSVHRDLGIALARHGEKAHAAAELREALRLTPGDAQARDELRRLE